MNPLWILAALYVLGKKKGSNPPNPDNPGPNNPVGDNPIDRL